MLHDAIENKHAVKTKKKMSSKHTVKLKEKQKKKKPPKQISNCWSNGTQKKLPAAKRCWWETPTVDIETKIVKVAARDAESTAGLRGSAEERDNS